MPNVFQNKISGFPYILKALHFLKMETSTLIPSDTYEVPSAVPSQSKSEGVSGFCIKHRNTLNQLDVIESTVEGST